MTKRKGIDRREFVTTTTGAAAAVALGPTILIKRREKTLKILQWSHFVPCYDVWFDKYAKDWGTAKGVEVTVDHIASPLSGRAPTPRARLSTGPVRSSSSCHRARSRRRRSTCAAG